jgi:hypothetical protein
LVTGYEYETLITSGYVGRPGDLLLLRVLPPLPGTDLALAMTTPYLITSPGIAEWELYFRRTLGPSEPVRRYEALMKHGWPPHGSRYWTEYIFEAYVNHETEVVFLSGLPDLEQSRPHSRVNAGRERFASPKSRLSTVKAGAPLAAKASPRSSPATSHAPWQSAGQILKTLPRAKLDELPKLSETILKFGEPLLVDAPPGATADEYRAAMQLVEMAWNFPILTQHSAISATLVRDVNERLGVLPPEFRTLLEGMFRARATVYAHDPRTAHIRVEEDERGSFSVKAEARLIPGAVPE